MRQRDCFPIVCVLAIVVAACGDDGATAGESTTGTSAASTSTTDDTTTSSTTEEASTSSTGPVGPLTCKRACDLPATCCTADMENCPSMTYPGNWGCFNDVCVLPQCMVDSECESVAPGTTCQTVNGLSLCAQLCQSDDECPGNRSCLPTTDDGQRFCFSSCTNGAVFCPPGQVCDEATGQCLCESDEQCPAGFLCRP